MTDRWWDFLCNWITLTGHAWTKVQGPQKWLLSSVLKWLKLLVWVVAVCIILALSKFSLANWFGILWKKHKKRQYYDSEGWPHPSKNDWEWCGRDWIGACGAWWIFEQGQVGQKGATCGSSKECVTDSQTDRPTNWRTQPVKEVLCHPEKGNGLTDPHIEMRERIQNDWEWCGRDWIGAWGLVLGAGAREFISLSF